MSIADYPSIIDDWERRATIRTRPRRVLENDDNLIYPLCRQPLVLSATFLEHCPQWRDFVLLQSFYKFINDVVIFETEIVDRTARRIAKNRFSLPFPLACRIDAMTVVVDEDYHALVALDLLQQTVAMTGIRPLQLPEQIELSRALPAAQAEAPAHLRDAVELIGVAIAENTVTQDVAAFSKDSSVKASIRGLMADHLFDEGRHAQFWTRLVRLYWQAASPNDRDSIAQVLPTFLAHYLTNDLQKNFDLELIEHLGVSTRVRSALGDEIRALAFPITRQHPLMGNIMAFLQHSGLLQTPSVAQALNNFLPVRA
ncbi:aminobenzoate oxygenase [Pseudomonas fluorescens]|uniref:Diiron oxygenase n=1 Tax=Pseudomonas lactucae TaxID=2813360 RepID=A0A9X0YFX5_9PSED|nr:diiron oxygenase [Pseudomonas lactucae]OPA99461.1 aminobenzoate oxygenase [Pseudomonas fluorescens]MBN2979168.1 diiron oxygenase [Pseudomonas lactucae]MBN2985685.1 diiron oxygenase [Pseudomonas lactucae]OPB15764.1 aminobenzoate oxygenase [Pseudomonas fluorescens]OPB28760.1 aminobenzoate oxygenase [Pseudomonas fluorescens]